MSTILITRPARTVRPIPLRRVDVAREPAPPTAMAARWWIVAAVVLVSTVHGFIISAGHFNWWPMYSAYYDMQTTAFMHGQISLLEKPDPRILKLANPYDPYQNIEFALHDASLYKGKYYLYWGPAPALLMIPARYFFGLPIGDHYLVAAFTFGIMCVTSLLMYRVWRARYWHLPGWTLALGVVVMGLATPMSYILARAAVYEAAITAGQFFLLSALLVAYCALEGWIGPRRRDVLLPGIGSLLTIGVLGGFAIASRPSLLFAVGALVALLAWRIARVTQDPSIHLRRRLIALAALLVPLGVIGAGLAAYNYARFESFTEFGQKYQLTSHNQYSTPGLHLFSLKNVPPGLCSYLLRPVYPFTHFPFFYARDGRGMFPSFIHLPEHYEFQEQISGILIVTPFIWLAALPLVLWRRRAGEISPIRGDESNDNVSAAPDSLRWLIVVLLAAGLLGFAPVVFMIGSTMRYLADLTPSLLVVAMIGLWQRMDALRTSTAGQRRSFLVIAMMLAVVSVVIGVLMSFTGYYSHFENYNPALYYKLGAAHAQVESEARDGHLIRFIPPFGEPAPPAMDLQN